MTQQERLINLFYERKTLTNYELRALQPPIFQYPVRIKELRELGYDIRGEFSTEDKKKYVYTFYGAFDSLPREVAWHGSGNQLNLIGAV